VTRCRGALVRRRPRRLWQVGPPARLGKEPCSRRSSQWAGVSQSPRWLRARYVVRLALFLRQFSGAWAADRSLLLSPAVLWWCTRFPQPKPWSVLRRPAGHRRLPAHPAALRPNGASWGGRSHPTRRGRRAGHPKAVSGESCRTPLMDDSKIAPSSTTAARVHSQCSIVPDRTGSLPKQADSCSVQRSRGSAVGGTSHDFIEHLRPGPAKPESCSVLAVSHDFDGLLRVRSAGLLHPAANHGVRLVSSYSQVLAGLHQAVCFEPSPEGEESMRTARCVPARVPAGLPAAASSVGRRIEVQGGFRCRKTKENYRWRPRPLWHRVRRRAPPWLSPRPQAHRVP
jgi:hypothetical protein